jgi:hypothetical protein
MGWYSNTFIFCSASIDRCRHSKNGQKWSKINKGWPFPRFSSGPEQGLQLTGCSFQYRKYCLLLLVCFGYSELSGNAIGLYLQDTDFESLALLNCISLGFLILPRRISIQYLKSCYHIYLLPNIYLLNIHDHLPFESDDTKSFQFQQCL